MQYFVYLVKCSDGSYYCGYSTDLESRIREHNNSEKGAKYTRSRRPVELVYSEEFDSKSEAMRREFEIKQLTHKEKKGLFSQDL